MAERPTVLSRTLTRDKIALITGNRPELIRAMEDILKDITGTLPDSIEGGSTEADSVLKLAGFAPPSPQPALLITDTASAILAAQIFGA